MTLRWGVAALVLGCACGTTPSPDGGVDAAVPDASSPDAGTVPAGGSCTAPAECVSSATCVQPGVCATLCTAVGDGGEVCPDGGGCHAAVWLCCRGCLCSQVDVCN